MTEMLPRSLLRTTLLVCGLLSAVWTAQAADTLRTERVAFKQGASSTVIEGRIKGYETVDYVLGARAGQRMDVSLKTRHGATYFNLLAPGENEVSMFNGSISENHFEGTLPASGDYKIRVYMLRSAARRNEVAPYTLSVAIAGDAKAALGKAPASDAKIKGTPFHATGPLPCRLGAGQPQQCQFGVIRGKPGNAEVHIQPPGKAERVITFMGERVTTNPGDRIKAVKQGDDWQIEVNDSERYTIPEAVISGG